MSKFDYGVFRGGYDEFAVSKTKYTKEQAIKLFIKEMMIEAGREIAMCQAHVRHGFGVDEEGDRYNGWWLCYEPTLRSHEVWAFHLVRKNENFLEAYEVLVVKDGELFED